ncbi:gluconate kinase [Xylanibacillus composti]|nr:gluconate kinase [Xylanibacillus composti]
MGTTAVKTLLVKADGTAVASVSLEYPLHTPEPGAAELDPKELLQAAEQGIRDLLKGRRVKAEQVRAVSFSAAMHSLMAVDEQGRPLSRLYTWADSRAAEAAAQLKRDKQGLELYRRTGVPIHPMSPLAKLIWLRKVEPDLWKKTDKWIGIKEYLFHSWFGTYVVDYSLANATGLFHMESLSWDSQALELAGIQEDQLSKPVSPETIIRGMSAETADRLGLLPDTPFVIGASDGVLANLAADALRPGEAAISIGTSGAVRAAVERPLTDKEGRLFCYYLSEQCWIVGGPVNNGGIVLRWIRDAVAPRETAYAKQNGIDPYEHFTALAQEVPAGSEGLLFLPYLTGERAPYWNADQRGVYFGLSLQHDIRHMVRAAMEGVLFAIESIVDPLKSMTGDIHTVRASGGFANSPFWCQMMADVLGIPVRIPDSVEGSAIGAVKLAMLATGAVKSYDELAGWNGGETVYEPNPHNHEVYRQLIPIHRQLAESSDHAFQSIARFQQQKRI